MNEKTRGLKKLLERGADVNTKIGPTSVLHIAVAFCKHRSLKCLLEHDSIDVNVMEPCGVTPLHLAVDKGCKECALPLIHHPKTNFALGGSPCGTALHLALLSVSYSFIMLNHL